MKTRLMDPRINQILVLLLFTALITALTLGLHLNLIEFTEGGGEESFAAVPFRAFENDVSVPNSWMQVPGADRGLSRRR